MLLLNNSPKGKLPMSKSRKDGQMSVCCECGDEFYVPPSHRKETVCCSRTCRAKAQTKWQTKDLSERFWQKVNKTETCWLWTGAMLKTGYGSIRVNHKAERAHRVAYELSVGPIQAGRILLHSCDNPLCVNPSHLRPGDKRENTNDAIARGQHATGERSARSKLSGNDVKIIKAAIAAGITGRSLAKTFSVDETTISHIKLGKSWKHS
jgi:hypothetical protein